MEIVKARDYDEMSLLAAERIASLLKEKKNALLGLATGSTPVGTYRKLVEMTKKGEISFRDVKSVNLDEYVGLSPEDPQSYRFFMQENLFDHVDVKRENTFVPDGQASDLEKTCFEYDHLIHRLGGTDLQLLGIGHNGHIGFNEPSETVVKPTHVVTLSRRTREANARFFGSIELVPTQAVTMGILPIMQARRILVLASGADKAKIVKEAFFGPITPKVPASILQLHPFATLIADAEALKECETLL